MADEAYALNKSDAEMAIRMLAQGPPPASIADKPQSAALRLYQFEIKGPWSQGEFGQVADADINAVGGGEAVRDKVTDYFSMFSELGIGSQGFALCQGATFYIIQAPCP